MRGEISTSFELNVSSDYGKGTSGIIGNVLDAFDDRRDRYGEKLSPRGLTLEKLIEYVENHSDVYQNLSAPSPKKKKYTQPAQRLTRKQQQLADIRGDHATAVVEEKREVSQRRESLFGGDDFFSPFSFSRRERVIPSCNQKGREDAIRVLTEAFNETFGKVRGADQAWKQHKKAQRTFQK